MKQLKNQKKNPYVLGVILFFMGSFMCIAQIFTGVYVSKIEDLGTTTTHELKLNKDYLVYNVYKNNPANFITTIGGFYSTDDKRIKVDLEFNSHYESDSLKTWEVTYRVENENLILELDGDFIFEPKPQQSQDLDGTWLFATRGPDVGQDRRGEDSSRKTLKFLKDGTFQWIAYDTDSFKFSGTGGGSYTAIDGSYTEQIAFFSRDNLRVGATLGFNYTLKGDDWHHTGKNSKGEPTYEIWAKRE